MSYHHPIAIRQRQRGAVLFVALVFLILITLLGLTASGTSILQERMTGGMRSSQLAMMGSETAARAAESWLWNLSATPGATLNCGFNGGDTSFCYKGQSFGLASDGVTTLMMNNPKIITFRSSPSWQTTGNDGGTTAHVPVMTGLSQASASLSQEPQYIMEDLGVVLPPGAPQNGQAGGQGRDPQGGKCAGCQSLFGYRITARSTGGNDASVRVVETYFGAGTPAN